MSFSEEKIAEEFLILELNKDVFLLQSSEG